MTGFSQHMLAFWTRGPMSREQAVVLFDEDVEF